MSSILNIWNKQLGGTLHLTNLPHPFAYSQVLKSNAPLDIPGSPLDNKFYLHHPLEQHKIENIAILLRSRLEKFASGYISTRPEAIGLLEGYIEYLDTSMYLEGALRVF